ncbi:MAG: HAD family hydrolase [Spirochaetales bacterium]
MDHLIRLIQQYSSFMEPVSVPLNEVVDKLGTVPFWTLECFFPPVVLFDVYGTLFQSASGEISLARIQGLDPSLDSLQPLEPFFPILPKGFTLKSLLTLFREEVEKRHEELRKKVPVPEIRVEEIWATVLRLDKEKAREFSLRFELSVNPVYPMPGALNALPYLRSLGIVLGVVSNAQFFTPFYFQAFFGASMEEIGFEKDLTVFSYQYGEAKPSTGLFQVVIPSLRKRNFSPHQVLYIGNDRLNDIYTPQQLGFKTALFCGDARSLRLRLEDPRCGTVKPDFLIHDLGLIKSTDKILGGYK